MLRDLFLNALQVLRREAILVPLAIVAVSDSNLIAQTSQESAISGSPLRNLSGSAGAAIKDRSASAHGMPRDFGQNWQDYDIAAFTSRVDSTEQPQRLLLDWILRETGYEAWHSHVPSVLSATKNTLSVYHTPAIQQTVNGIVERFVNPNTARQMISARLIAIGHPNWRAGAQPILHPVPVETQGIQAWLLAREDAALLVSDLARRADFREFTATDTWVRNGESVVVASSDSKSYVESVTTTAVGGAISVPATGTVRQGVSLEVSLLAALDGQSLEAMVRLHIDQLERQLPVLLNVSTAASGGKRAQIDVPQVASYRALERFRWPTRQVLLISFGVVPLPGPEANVAARLGIPFPTRPGRADVLLVLENKGVIDSSPDALRVGRRASNIQLQ